MNVLIHVTNCEDEAETALVQVVYNFIAAHQDLALHGIQASTFAVHYVLLIFI